MAFSFKQLFSLSSSGQHGSVVGIDIGSSSVKVVEISLEQEVPELKTYGELQLGPYFNKAIGETVPFDLGKHTTALTDVLREAGVSAEQAVLSMPLWSSFVATPTLELGAGESIDERIPILAKKYVPVSLSEVELDWAEIPGEKDQAGELFLVAMQKNAVANFQTLMERITVKEHAQELEVFSSLRAADAKGDAYAILDLGASMSKLYIVREGSVERLHRVAIGGEVITKRLLEQYGSFAEAEDAKRSGSVPVELLQQITAQTLTPMLQECTRVLDKYNMLKGTNITSVSLCGGVAATPGITGLVSDIMQKQVVNAKPFSLIQHPSFMEDLLTDLGPVFSVSLGAALRFVE